MSTDPNSADERRRQILSSVARGDLAPEQAAELLADIDREPAPAESDSTEFSYSYTTGSDDDRPSRSRGSDPPPSDPRPGGPLPGGTIRVVRVEGALRTVEILGDRAVLEAVVTSGPHSAHRDGDVLVIEGEPDFLGRDGDDDGDDDWGSRFRFRGPGWSAARANVIVAGHKRVIGAGRNPLVIRMHPDLELDAHVEAGTLTVRDVRGPITAKVQAGSAKIRGFASPLDLEVSAGSINATGRLDHGNSKVSCDAGSVRLGLDHDSSVEIDAESNLGKVSLPGESAMPTGIQAFLQGSQHATVGAGAGQLHITVNVGSATVVVDE